MYYLFSSLPYLRTLTMQNKGPLCCIINIIFGDMFFPVHKI